MNKLEMLQQLALQHGFAIHVSEGVHRSFKPEMVHTWYHVMKIVDSGFVHVGRSPRSSLADLEKKLYKAIAGGYEK